MGPHAFPTASAAAPAPCPLPPPPQVCHPRSSLLSPLSAPGDGDLVKAAASSVVPSTPLEGEGPGSHPPSEGSNQTARLSPPMETPQRPFPFVGGVTRGWRWGPPGPRPPPHAAQGPPAPCSRGAEVSLPALSIVPVQLGWVRFLPAGPEEGPAIIHTGPVSSSWRTGPRREAGELPARPAVPTSETNPHSQVGFPSRSAACILIETSSHRHQPFHL